MARSILVIGAGGLGLALAEEALFRYTDATVFATTRRQHPASALSKLRLRFPNRLVVVELELTDDASVQAAAESIRQQRSSLDMLFLVAGSFGEAGRLEDVSREELLEILDINVAGPHICLQAFTPLLLQSSAAHRGVFIMSASGASQRLFPAMSDKFKHSLSLTYLPMSIFAVSKTALNMLARQWADQLEPYGIVVALLSPGLVATESMKQCLGDLHFDLSRAGKTQASARDQARCLLTVSETATPSLSASGILNFNGSLLPW